jgi:hypothetical protein
MVIGPWTVATIISKRDRPGSSSTGRLDDVGYRIVARALCEHLVSMLKPWALGRSATLMQSRRV